MTVQPKTNAAIQQLLPLALKASFRWSSTSANLRTSLTSCIMSSGSAPAVSTLSEPELIELNDPLFAVRPKPHEPEPAERGKKWELGRRAIPSGRLLDPPLLCCSIPAPNISAAFSLKGTLCTVPLRFSNSQSFLSTDSRACVHNGVKVYLNL